MSSAPIDSWLDDLAARQPTPGGGAAGGLSAASAAALLAMVANYTTGTRYAQIESEMSEIAEELSGLRAAALEAMESDAVAFSAVGSAYAMAKASDEEKAARTAAIQVALVGATKPPLAVATICSRLVPIARVLDEKGNANVRSDVGVGAACAVAGLEAAILNVAINASQISDRALSGELREAIAQMDRDKDALAAVVASVRTALEGS